MWNRLVRPSGWSITGRLLAWFLAISLIPCVILTAVLSRLSILALQQSVKRDLMVISSSKATELETIARNRIDEVTALARVPSLVDAAVELREALTRGRPDTPEYRALVGKYKPFLTYVAEAFDYPNVILFAPGGEPLLRLKSDMDLGPKIQQGPLKGTELAGVIDRARTLLQTEMSDYQLYPGRAEPAAFIASPVLNDRLAVVGVIVFELNNEQVFQVFKDYTGLGETGETLVGTRAGNEIKFVAPLRFDKKAAFTRTITIGSERSPAIQRAVQGERGYGPVVDYGGTPAIAAWAYLPSFRWGMVVKQDTSEAYALIRNQRIAIIALALATIVTVSLVARAVARSLSRPIRDAARVAERVASGDLTAQVQVKGRGEAGSLLFAIETMTEYLRSLIGRIHRSSVALMSTATEIAATSRQQGQTVNAYGSSVQQAVAAVHEISATSQELLHTMDEVSNVAIQTSERASAGRDKLLGMDRTMHQLADSTGSIASKLSVISERASNINLVVTTITKVADQTNLLSINAAIEAEKAGEYGLGFLVVAREIRRLADQTAVATLDIERMVKEMQYSVSAGVMEMDKFREQVRLGVTEVGNISEQLSQIIADVESLSTRFELVNEGMRSQSQGADQIRQAMVRLSEAASQTTQSLQEFNRASEHLRDAVGELKEEVSRFRLDEE
jgi:methyl-accepting chemotaxis protein WspA